MQVVDGRYDSGGMTPPRIRLVALGEQHLETTRKWTNDPEMMRLLGRQAVVGAGEHRAWFDALKARGDCSYFAVETDDAGRHIGNIWLWNIDRRDRKAEVRILFGDEATRGRGYGSEAIALLAGLAFNRLQLHRLYAYVFAINPRAKRAFEKAGFQIEGVLREERWLNDGYVDVYLLARLASGDAVSRT